MKIENNRKEGVVKFEDLKLGDCFKRENSLYLKTECSYNDIDGEAEYNSVTLADGGLTYFEDNCWVENVNAKIVIE